MSVRRSSISMDSWRKKIARQYDAKPQYLIPILQFVQSKAGYLPPEAMRAAARHLRVPESKILGVASFDTQFRFEEQGKHKITICRGTACRMRGSGRIESDIEDQLKVSSGSTTSDKLFSLESVACFGSCALAPVAVVDDKVSGRETTGSLKTKITNIRVDEGVEKPPKKVAAKPAARPTAAKPAKKKPAKKKSAKKKPAKKKPVKKKPAKKKPARKKATRKKRARKKVARKKPARRKPARKKPARKKPARKKPARKKPARKKPARKKPARKKPARKKSNKK